MLYIVVAMMLDNRECFQMTGSLGMMVRMTSDMETHIVAVERINEYTEVEEEVRPWLFIMFMSPVYVGIALIPSHEYLHYWHLI